MIIFVDGFDKSGRTELANKIAKELAIVDGMNDLPLRYEQFDSFWDMMANLNWVSGISSNIVFDGSFISDDTFNVSDDELSIFAAWCQKHDVYFYFCHSKDALKLEGLSGGTHDQFEKHSTRLYSIFSGLRMFAPVVSHDIFEEEVVS